MAVPWHRERRTVRNQPANITPPATMETGGHRRQRAARLAVYQASLSRNAIQRRVDNDWDVNPGFPSRIGGCSGRKRTEYRVHFVTMREMVNISAGGVRRLRWEIRANTATTAFRLIEAPVLK